MSVPSHDLTSPDKSAGHMKHKMQQGIAWLHVKLARKPRPDRLAIYFHELEPHQWPEFRDAISYLKDRGYRSTTASDFVAAGADDGINDLRHLVKIPDRRKNAVRERMLGAR